MILSESELINIFVIGMSAIAVCLGFKLFLLVFGDIIFDKLTNKPSNESPYDLLGSVSEGFLLGATKEKDKNGQME